MRCPRCEFENMPGLTACIRCGSVLLAEEPVDIDPPRAKGWRKRLRPLRRTWRRLGPPIPSARDILPQGVWPTLRDSGLGDAVVDIFLGLVPGLLYLMRRRYQALLIGGGLFLLLLLGAIFFYGSWLGNLCAGLAAGAHAIMLLHSTGLTRSMRFGSRVVVSLLVVLVVSTVDRRVARIVNQDFVGAYTTMPIPAHNIQDGDFLLARRSLRTRPNPLPRGTVVLARLPTLIAAYNGPQIGANTVPTFGQIVGRPGETVSIEGDQFRVDDHLLDAGAYPLTDWLASQEISVTVPDDTYYVNARYRYNQFWREQTIDDDVLLRMVLVPSHALEARAIMRWQPLRRRGFLRTLP